MAIEVTSIPDKFGVLRPLRRTLECVRYDASSSRGRVIFRSLICLLIFALIVGGDSLLRSYKYYSRIIDARLASGYLTSRPGIYAAPRLIQRGQKLSAPGLIRSLRRAGYVEANGSSVWSGTFIERTSEIEIRPERVNGSRPSVVRITFDEANRVAELTGDNLRLEQFALEPEALSNDLSFKTGKRETLAFSEMPPVLVHAILSIEDRRFFDHSGLDAFGIARALIRNVNDERAAQGGSTITQQLVKNTYLSPERTLRRKFAEAMLAIALERRLSKQDIFALYCNEIYLGQRGAVAARGFKEAAHLYFGKELKQLSLSEAATLAGMIQSPGRYSPVHNIETAQASEARRNIVLAAMMRNGWISAAELDASARMPLVVAAAAGTNSLAPYFVDYVNRKSAREDDHPLNNRTYTTIDLDLQQLAETALARQLNKLDASAMNRNDRPQAALVALDPHTGNVLAMVGGRDYAESQLNRATDARRQPGSTFKPFVYAAALEDGMSPVRTFADGPREFVYDRNKTYRPANFGGAYAMRDVTMRTALVKSLNVVTVDIALQTGLARISNLVEKFGLPRPEKYPALALGTKEVTPLELAAAYASFVNGGRRVEPRVIESIGEPPAAHASAHVDEQVVSPTTAYMITNMLSAVVDHGTARGARDLLKITAVAGKTGTSRDGWFVGYTPNLVCVVWIGFDDSQQLGRTGAEAALPAWMDFMKGAVELKPELGGRSFECPEGIRFVEIDSDAGSLSTLSCPHRELIAVTDRLAPNLECFVHGNLPPAIEGSGGNPESSESMTVAHHRTPAKLKKLIFPVTSSRFGSTRIDVDRKGKRTLVNDLR